MPGRTDAVIELSGVTFRYGSSGACALDHVDLQVHRGDFLGVIGPSGAGKSTLVAAMTGAIPHHFKGEMGGAIRVGGVDVQSLSLAEVARTVGSVGQDIEAHMVSSHVESELLFGLENFGVAHDEIPGRVDEALRRVGIEGLRDREIATLSGGQKQKVAIAAMVALRPQVLVLDEPTAALDPASSREVFALLRELNERSGVTVVVVEQKVALLAEFCARVAVMDAGSIAVCAPTREVFGRGRMLREIGVDCPRVTRVSNSLRDQGIASGALPRLTVDEACALAVATMRHPRAACGYALPESRQADMLRNGARRGGV